jgi:hypothetical protein
MAIFLGSRYEDSLVDFYSTKYYSDPAPVVFYKFSALPATLRYIEYTWKEGDRIDNIAFKYLSYPDKWWVLGEYNPHVKDLTNIPAGTKLVIPIA